MIQYLIIFILLFYSSIVEAQTKFFTNEVAYKADTDIYIFDSVNVSIDINRYKEFFCSKDKATLKKIDSLVSLKKIAIIRNIFLVRDTTKETLVDFLFEEEESQVIGPFSSKYGVCRFIKIDDSSNKSRVVNGLINHEGMNYGSLFLSYKKGSKRRVQRFSKQLVCFYKTGKRYNFILKKIKKFRSPEKGSNDFVDLPQNRKKIEALVAGEHCLVLEHSEGLGVFLIQKRTKGYESVRYTEYVIFEDLNLTKD